jgi:hypothetical protein
VYKSDIIIPGLPDIEFSPDESDQGVEIAPGSLLYDGNLSDVEDYFDNSDISQFIPESTPLEDYVFDGSVATAVDDSEVLNEVDSIDGVIVPIEDIPNPTSSRELNELRKTWMAAPSFKKRISKPVNRFAALSLLEICVNQLLFKNAMKSVYREDASKALDKELDNIRDKKVFRGIRLSELTEEQLKLILPSMINFVLKHHPNGDFDKCKVRLLARGDLQTVFASTEGPVCRVETIFVLIICSVYHDLEIFILDFVSAYLNTSMPESVKHRWLRLGKEVSKRLVEREPEIWIPFLNPDGTIVVEMNKLIYGYREAAHFWNKILIEMFVGNGWEISPKDPCFLYKQSASWVQMVAITVDDCTFGVSRGFNLKQEIVCMCEKYFEAVTVSEGDILNVIGMRFEVDRNLRSVSVSQRKFADKTIARFNPLNKMSKLPYRFDLFKEVSDSPLLKDQMSFLAINSTVMFGAKRTYPELLCPATTLAERYNNATENDYEKAEKMVHYINYTKEFHQLYLRPKSLKVVACADASYAEHMDCKSRSGGCVGFEGYDGENCYFIFDSQKQPIVAKSSSEAELIALNQTADVVEWLLQLLEGIGPAFYTGDPVEIFQDNTSTMQIAKSGTGSFKRSKHIKVRYFWIKGLIDAGRVFLTYLATALMLADILTKPITGSRFLILVRRLLGWNQLPGGGPLGATVVADSEGIDDGDDDKSLNNPYF